MSLKCVARRETRRERTHSRDRQTSYHERPVADADEDWSQSQHEQSYLCEYHRQVPEPEGKRELGERSLAFQRRDV